MEVDSFGVNVSSFRSVDDLLADRRLGPQLMTFDRGNHRRPHGCFGILSAAFGISFLQRSRFEFDAPERARSNLVAVFDLIRSQPPMALPPALMRKSVRVFTVMAVTTG